METITSAAQVPLTLTRGGAFLLPIVYRDSEGDPIDLSGYSAKMQIRESPLASDALVSLSSATGGITLGGTTGVIQLSIYGSQTLGLPIASLSYDLFIIDSSNNPYKLMWGEIKVVPSTTDLT